ncbi:hypothetical protein BN874_1260012 [Candidatus Contendobacter odensis Run_B_J11]|uniref:Uncharacterized protein n=1 Tax=Candidatus Contendobacter odensis Run_B_J11 TaxID=1400861 RepID=A0A7U7G8M2_9GAMM|nr:hypothetical protein BN874_1260012 [Candidatus Contendobacter odensis Run_B_J11]
MNCQNRLNDFVHLSCTVWYCLHYLHHCFSQGMPSLFPSILTPGQFLKKKVASSQDVIWEQCVLPSHLKLETLLFSLLELFPLSL